MDQSAGTSEVVQQGTNAKVTFSHDGQDDTRCAILAFQADANNTPIYSAIAFEKPHKIKNPPVEGLPFTGKASFHNLKSWQPTDVQVVCYDSRAGANVAFTSASSDFGTEPASTDQLLTPASVENPILVVTEKPRNKKGGIPLLATLTAEGGAGETVKGETGDCLVIIAETSNPNSPGVPAHVHKIAKCSVKKGVAKYVWAKAPTETPLPVVAQFLFASGATQFYGIQQLSIPQPGI